MNRINVGCGATPTAGWLNYDNSLVARLGRFPLMLQLLNRTGLLGTERGLFATKVAAGEVQWADAVRLPNADGSVDVVYSSHMLEHLDRHEARRFLAEAKRVLRPGGIIRVAVPDLSILVHEYQQTGDADEFIGRTLLTHARGKRLAGRIRDCVVGPRHHAWMYDGPSLVRLLKEAGFTNVGEFPPGSTMICDPGELDLREREVETVYVEANAPVGLSRVTSP